VHLLITLNLLVWVGALPQTAAAGSMDRAKRIHDRLAGVPPSDAVLSQMAAYIDADNVTAAAELAMEDDNF